MKKRALTLIEVMVVILLIGLIGGALAFNMRGSMDRGKAFKTEQKIARAKEVLMMEQTTGTYTNEQLQANAEGILKESGLVQSDPLKGGWNENLEVEVNEETGEIVITSKKLAVYQSKHQPVSKSNS